MNNIDTWWLGFYSGAIACMVAVTAILVFVRIKRSITPASEIKPPQPIPEPPPKPESPPVRFCKDCKHSVLVPAVTLTPGFTNPSTPATLECSNQEVLEQYVWLRAAPEGTLIPCARERDGAPHMYSCARPGKLWEAKEVQSEQAA